MNYWDRWIGDWKRKTAHLSAEAKGIYGELLDHAYATESPLPLDHEQVYRLAGARTASECKNTDKVLACFFLKTDSGYVNKRASEEISKRQSFVAAQRERANARWHRQEEVAAPKQRKINGHKIAFDHDQGIFIGITEDDELRWQEAYPAAIVPEEIKKAAAWLKANPANRKKNNERFLVNWFSRIQERAPRVST